MNPSASPIYPACPVHRLPGGPQRRNERRVWRVIVLTVATMVAEIVAGQVYGSMALLADGWHMATHAAALLITALAYGYARRHQHDTRYTFGTGKLGELAGFASALMLAMVALLVGWESLLRLSAPTPIAFDQALLVAVIGLSVNLVSAWLLREDHSHPGHMHSHEHSHEHDGHPHSHPHARDNNLRAAYLHVLTDALTSVLAIVALLAGRNYGWYWADPAMGVLGALIIARWSWGLLRETARVLLDAAPASAALAQRIRQTLAETLAESPTTAPSTLNDLHVWQIGPGQHAALVALTGKAEPGAIKTRLAKLAGLAHVTVEVTPQPLTSAARRPASPE